MSRERPDFATIRLSDAGKRMAGEHGVIRWANGRRHFAFTAGEPQEVERSYEWNHLLRHELYQGEPIFEEVEVEAAVELATEPPTTQTTTEPEPADEPGTQKSRRKV